MYTYYVLAKWFHVYDVPGVASFMKQWFSTPEYVSVILSLVLINCIFMESTMIGLQLLAYYLVYSY